MTDFIVKDEKLHNELVRELDGPPFNSPEYFVALYNEGIINKSYEKNDEIAKKIASAYKNLRLVGKEFIEISKETVIVSELTEAIEVWRATIETRDLINKLREEGRLDDSEPVVMRGDKSNHLGVIRINDDDEQEFTTLGLVTGLKKVAHLFGKQPENSDDVFMNQEDILSFDTSALQSAWDIIVRPVE